MICEKCDAPAAVAVVLLGDYRGVLCRQCRNSWHDDMQATQTRVAIRVAIRLYEAQMAAISGSNADGVTVQDIMRTAADVDTLMDALFERGKLFVADKLDKREDEKQNPITKLPVKA